MSEQQAPPPMSVPHPNTSEIEHLQPLLARYFRRHWRHESDIDDLVQETLLRLVRAPVQADNTEAYAVRIANNLPRDRARRDQSHRADQHTAYDETLA